MPPEVFLDASYPIALASPRDACHATAKVLARRLEEETTRLITTRAVLFEIGNALARARHREAAIQILDAIESDAQIEIVPVSEDLYGRAFLLYRQRRDKEWGLTDCVSFTVMRERGLSDALTADEHFRQAGFRALLLET